MAKKKAKSAKAKAEDAERRRRVILASVGVVGALGLCAGVWIGLDRLDARASSIATPEMVEVAFAWPALDGADAGDESATWMPASERERLRTMAVDAARGGSTLDSAALREVCRALSTTGWYAQDPEVRRLGDGSISVSGEWRLPAAVVRGGERERLVAWDGSALALEYGVGRSGVHYLTNASHAAPATSGAPWEGADVNAGLALLDLLNDREDVMAQVVGIDLGRGGPLEIITDEDARIVWGTAPGVFRPGEQPTDIKISRIGWMLDKTGRIDGGLAVVDLRGPDVLTQRRER